MVLDKSLEKRDYRQLSLQKEALDGNLDEKVFWTTIWTKKAVVEGNLEGDGDVRPNKRSWTTNWTQKAVLDEHLDEKRF